MLMVESKRSRKSDNYNKNMIYIVSLEEYARKICKNNNSHSF